MTKKQNEIRYVDRYVNIDVYVIVLLVFVALASVVSYGAGKDAGVAVTLANFSDIRTERCTQMTVALDAALDGKCETTGAYKAIAEEKNKAVLQIAEVGKQLNDLQEEYYHKEFEARNAIADSCVLTCHEMQAVFTNDENAELAKIATENCDRSCNDKAYSYRWN